MLHPILYASSNKMSYLVGWVTDSTREGFFFVSFSGSSVLIFAGLEEVRIFSRWMD